MSPPAKPTGPLVILQSVPYFAVLDESAQSRLATMAIRREFETGQIIYSEGEPCPGLCVVQEGWVKAVKLSPAGREQVVCVAGPGEACNEIGVFAGVPNPATVLAFERTVTWVVPGDLVLEMLGKSPAMAREVARSLALRVQHMLSLVEDLSFRSVEARLARLLLERASGNTLHRFRWATQNEMAARLGTVPDVLSRELRKLAEQGIIQVQRHQIQILDPQALEARALSDD